MLNLTAFKQSMIKTAELLCAEVYSEFFHHALDETELNAPSLEGNSNPPNSDANNDSHQPTLH